MMSTIDAIRAIMRIRNPAELGGLIRNRRRQLGIEQSALAQKVGVSRKWIIEIEKGKPRAALGLVLRTLSALDICLDAQTDTARKPKSSTAVIDLDALIESARKPRT
jgi:HTH-type transcriptional regulator/antitoxin HipB